MTRQLFAVEWVYQHQQLERGLDRQMAGQAGPSTNTLLSPSTRNCTDRYATINSLRTRSSAG